MSDSIAFPNLGIYLPHVIKSFTVFGYEIAVYGITMALGILAGMYMAVYVAKKTGQDADDYMNGGIPGISGFASPDGRYVYVVGDILANSTGWVCTLIIYQVDTKTLKAKLVNGVAAWRLEKDGFTVASETRCTTPDAEFSYQMDIAFEDITYGFDGKVKHKSKEYSSQEVEPRYGKNINAVKSLGVIRHLFYD